MNTNFLKKFYAPNIPINAPTTPDKIVSTTEDGVGNQHENVVAEWVDGGGNPVKTSVTNPMPVTDEAAEVALTSIAAEDFATQATLATLLTDTQLRATPVPVSISGGGGGAVTIADGADVAEGSTADAAVVTDANGTVSGKLRGLVKLFAAWIGTLGQKTMANSAPIVIASDQSAIPISGTVSTGGLTDVQLRATPVPVSGTLFSGAVTVADGANVVEGATADAAVSTDTTGTISGKLRGLVKLLAAWIGTLGQKTMANSAPVTIASDQASIPVAATLNAETTKVIGVIRNSDGAGNLLTSNSSTFSAKFALDANILGTLGTAFSTAGKVDIKSTQSFTDATVVALAVTALQSLASSATVGWQSVLVKNHVTKYNDFKIWVKLTTANTAPANDKAMYVWIIPWYTSDNGTTFNPSSIGTVTLPTGTDAAMTIASPHNLRLLGVLNYTTAQAVVQDMFLLSNCFGNAMPDGFSVGVTNFSGAALSTGCIVDYTGLTYILV